MSTKKQEAKELFNDANKLYDGQLYEEALERYWKATEIDLTFYDAHFCVAKTHIRLQSFAKGTKHFKKHVHLIPEEDRATYSIGLAGILMEEDERGRAYELVKKYRDEVSSEQLYPFLKILLANGKINLLLQHLLNLPFEQASEIYEQLVNDQAIAEKHRNKLQQHYVLPEYHDAVEKATMLYNAPVDNAPYSQKTEGVLEYTHQAKKDFGENLQVFVDNLKDKITETQHLLADRVRANIDERNTSRAQSQLVVLEKTDYDPVKNQDLRSSLATVKKQKRNKYMKYGGVALLAVLLLTAAVFGYGYLNHRWAWSEAQEADTYEAYREYIMEYPEGSNIDEAKELAETNFWEGIKKDSTQARYEQYLDEYPNGQFSHEARDILNTKLKTAPQDVASSNNERTLRQNTIVRNARVTGSDVIIRSDHTTESEVAGVVEQEGSVVKILDEYYPENVSEAILNRAITVYEDGDSINLNEGKAVSILSTGSQQVRVSFAHEDHGRVETTIDRDKLDGISGQKWYKIRTSDSTNGWIYGKFIKEL